MKKATAKFARAFEAMLRAVIEHQPPVETRAAAKPRKAKKAKKAKKKAKKAKHTPKFRRMTPSVINAAARLMMRERGATRQRLLLVKGFPQYSAAISPARLIARRVKGHLATSKKPGEPTRYRITGSHIRLL